MVWLRKDPSFFTKKFATKGEKKVNAAGVQGREPRNNDSNLKKEEKYLEN